MAATRAVSLRLILLMCPVSRNPETLSPKKLIPDVFSNSSAVPAAVAVPAAAAASAAATGVVDVAECAVTRACLWPAYQPCVAARVPLIRDES
eukprot:CAMPEP_0173131972 /NCGR_PEP_ID=MMETSP1102-20130122/60966_1 /TAXON_ID=49646 /ORGANISM="Geminigera sp., Strain Caron Lab Isolate" /LENGTH=92 /DNA_ID=CAMNT_0014043405 /DNA_START=336 /DNA_END=615 /DNA_ORIENTATION=+